MSDVIKQRLRMINAIGSAVVVSVLAGTVAFGVVPLYQNANRNMKDSNDLQKQLHDLEILNVKLARAEAEKTAREARLAEAEAHFPTSSAMNQFVQELAKVAEDSGLGVDGVVPSKDLKDAGAYKLMTVQVTGSGDWDTCYRFLTGLWGVNRKLTRLDALTIEQIKDQATNKTTCHISADISTFITR